ncbi:cytochrome p450 domain-containing protein [Hirsutella rhossiliensis]|uniref:Cytochrome p450 domain-containing protein n=1 Tax=Hirsutella rhossiliensis TaxID=111463 RepID=A0A9P8SCI1_9HYPO|nr:cytochrome p450 domain-containing protein [Hirsutella rhossiliensis]KAH0957586.1 cytochrome p450 domain-containing protein [Hirsutella rhossiliensis]
MALSELLGAVAWGRVAGYSVLLLVACFVVDFATLPRCPEQIPAFGFGHGIWAHLRNSIAYFTSHKAWVEEGYAKYNKKGLPFAVPAAISRHADIVLPQSLVSWLVEQPDDVLSAHRAHNEILYGDYNFLSRKVAHDGFGGRVVHKSLPRNLPGLIPAVDDEIQHAAGLALGHVTEDEWVSVNLWDLWLEIVPRVTNMMLAGRAVSRDEGFLKAMVAFTDTVVRNCILLGLCPRALHPFVGRLLAIPNWLQWRRAHRTVGPVIEKRLEDMGRMARGDLEYKDWAAPEDFITWLIRLAMKEGRTSDLDPITISLRLLPLEFASIHTTVLTGHSWMLDLLSTPPEEGILDVLGAEVRAHMPASPGGAWTKAALASLMRLDSSIRESQRVSNFADTLIERVVVAPRGLRHPDFDWTLPRGAFVTVNLEGTHHDDDLHSNARAYDPLRFARIREGARGARALGMVTTSDRHFAFGHGRHACPGRFFVAHELKLIMAHLLLNYDFKSLPQRPQPRWIGATNIPPLGARIEIRRKRTDESEIPKRDS